MNAVNPFLSFAFRPVLDDDLPRQIGNDEAVRQARLRLAGQHFEALIHEDDASDLARVRMQVADVRLLDEHPPTPPDPAHSTAAIQFLKINAKIVSYRMQQNHQLTK